MEKLLKNPACLSMSGNKRLFFSSVKNIKSIDLVNDTTVLITFLPGADWVEVETSEVNFSSKKPSNNFGNEITSQFNAAANKYDRYFNRMTEDRFICKVVDNNLVNWIFGSLEFPLHFEFEHASGPTAVDSHIYELHFFNKSLDTPMISES